MSFFTSQFMIATFDGLSNGMIYALIALSLVLVWQASHVLNFAQGAMAMFASYITITLLDRGLGFWPAIVIAIFGGFVIGGASERVLIRPTRGKPEINPVVVMVGFLTAVEAIVPMIWGGNPRNFPSPFSQVGFRFGAETIDFSPYDLFMVVAVLVVAGATFCLFKFTNVGLKLRAAAYAPEVARLLGVRVNRMLTLGWALAGAIGAIAGILYASNNAAGVTPNDMDLVFIIGFIAAAIGGLESPGGAIAGGVIIGLVLDYVTTYFNQAVGPMAVVAALVVVLMVRPHGLFSKPAARRV